MLLLGISGHSGAGKSRLMAALPGRGIACPRVILYTSRPSRPGEVHGRDYYFLSRAAVAALPADDFLVGPTRNILQAVDLVQLETDLKDHDLVVIELHHDLWLKLIPLLTERLGRRLRTAAVFMTAVDPEKIRSLPDERRQSACITAEVEKILTLRKKDSPEDIQIRSRSAVPEILEAVGPEGQRLYAKVFHSAPEGPDGEDDWTREDHPVGRAGQVLDEFTAFFRAAGE